MASLAWIGTEFMPRLDEGSVLVQTRKLPGISLTDSIAISGKTEKVLLQFPEVRSVVTKLGRPDLATEAMGIYEADVYVLLKPQQEWTTASTKEGLIEKWPRGWRAIPGTVNNFTQPMAMRLDETDFRNQSGRRDQDFRRRSAGARAAGGQSTANSSEQCPARPTRRLK